nr:hypothetical protein CFP56_70016 [Quercus suber]
MCLAASMVTPGEACRRDAGEDQTRMRSMATEVGFAPPLVYILYKRISLRPSPRTSLAPPDVLEHCKRTHHFQDPSPDLLARGSSSASTSSPASSDQAGPKTTAVGRSTRASFPAHTCCNSYGHVASCGSWRMKVPRPIHAISPPIVHPSVHLSRVCSAFPPRREYRPCLKPEKDLPATVEHKFTSRGRHRPFRACE